MRPLSYFISTNSLILNFVYKKTQKKIEDTRIMTVRSLIPISKANFQKYISLGYGSGGQ